jgi:hypothetical protein
MDEEKVPVCEHPVDESQRDREVDAVVVSGGGRVDRGCPEFRGTSVAAQ